MKSSQAKEMIDSSIDALIESLQNGQSQLFIEYLETMSRFHNYSLGNILLITMQRPSATHVAGFHAWRKLNRFVKKREKGIAIIAPLLCKEQTVDDDATDSEYADVTGFKVVYVFDISQTDGQELPQVPSVTGDTVDYLPKLDQLITESDILLEYSDSIPGEGCSCGSKILIRPGLSLAQEFSVKVHEFAHELLHRSAEKLSKTIKETEAEAVAYVVCYSIDLYNNTAASDYILHHKGDKETLLGSLQRIKETSHHIIARLQ